MITFRNTQGYSGYWREFSLDHEPVLGEIIMFADTKTKVRAYNGVKLTVEYWSDEDCDYKKSTLQTMKFLKLAQSQQEVKLEETENGKTRN